MSDTAFLQSVGVGVGQDPRIARLDEKIDGLRDARQILSEAKRVARWRAWAGKSTWHTVSALAAASEKIGRDLKKLKDERERLEARAS